MGYSFSVMLSTFLSLSKTFFVSYFTLLCTVKHSSFTSFFIFLYLNILKYSLCSTVVFGEFNGIIHSSLSHSQKAVKSFVYKTTHYQRHIPASETLNQWQRRCHSCLRSPAVHHVNVKARTHARSSSLLQPNHILLGPLKVMLDA